MPIGTSLENGGISIILSNFHMHCRFCDGLGEPEDYIEEAVKRGLKVLGFSCHAPFPFENNWAMKEEEVSEYIESIGKLKKLYGEYVEIYTGLEIDYLEGDNRMMFDKYKVDYIIGSVHFFSNLKEKNYYSIDGSKEDFNRTLHELFNGDIKNLVKSYYGNIINMIKEYKPEIIGHLDVVKKNNTNERYFSEEEIWYREIIDDVLQVIEKNKTIVEVNTGGLVRGFTQDTYPSKWILKECQKKDIAIIINSDAHTKEGIDGFFEFAASVLRDMGYLEQTILKNGKWENIGI